MKPTILSPLEGSPKKHGPHLVLDVEAKAGMTQAKGMTRPFMVGVYDGREYRCFRDKHPPSTEDDCWGQGGCIDLAMCYLLTEPYRRRICYAHNGGRFDFLHMMPWLQAHAGKWNWRIIPAASGIMKLKVWKRGTSDKECWSFVDSVKLIPLSLKKAAKTFGVTQKDDEFDLDTHESNSLWERYNELDCVALYEVMAKYFEYIEDHLGGEVGLTLPATAMRLFRRRYLEEPIVRGASWHHFVRQGYYGGRVEVYEERGVNLYYRDINSSYATAMLEPVPCGDPHSWNGRPHNRFTDGEFVGFVQCRVQAPSMHIPPLPYRLGHKLVFPIGEFQGVWEWSELEHAMRLGVKVLEWGISVWYRARPALRAYSESLYAERVREPVDVGRRYVGKMALTNLYGKFGQNPARYQYCSQDGEGRNIDTDGMVRLLREVKDAPYIIPQIAARITARARVYLDQWMREVMTQGGKIYYCDTDGFLSDIWLPSSPDELGNLKIEYPEYDGRLSGRFLAPKMYWLWAEGWDGEAKAKGLQTDYKTVEALQKLERGECLIQDRLEKVGSLARAGFMRGPKLLQVPRHWRGYDASKRVHTGDGSTRPIVLA